MELRCVTENSRPFRPDSAAPRRITPADHVSLMCASALFAGLSSSACADILPSARMRTFLRDDVLFLQGQAIDTLALIQTGSVKLTQISAGGSEALLWIKGPGDAVDLQFPSNHCRHTCSARAMEPCRALVWEYQRLQSLFLQYPLIRSNIERILTSRLHELEERFREIATEKVARRLALLLTRLARHLGKNAPEGVEIGIRREELAQMTGATLFTISRVLSRWGELGIILPRRAGLIIPNPETLILSVDLDD